ncbi:hypothetical protein B7P43_G17540 [Cryptotermes secundus]|uniref:Uncharacterized protein n=1 Tax=Cryptotermes secundus TaxID=105785 RepID=A0A2J7Q0A8_9NEOP|nr:hypothetical protein B7P43_G17540 [Cryptotermes secundus]
MSVGDFRVIALQLSMQLDYTDFCCFLSEWEGRARSNHSAVTEWPHENNTANDPLADIQKIYSYLHIKLGLMKNSMEAMSRNGEDFRHLARKFHRVSDAKIKEGTFVGPQIKWVVNDKNSDKVLEGAKKRGWKAFILVVDNFMRRQSAKLAAQMLEAHRETECKYHLINTHHSRLDFFPTNVGAVSDVRGERFHEEMSAADRSYQRKRNRTVLAVYKKPRTHTSDNEVRFYILYL